MHHFITSQRALTQTVLTYLAGYSNGFSSYKLQDRSHLKCLRSDLLGERQPSAKDNFPY